MFIADPMAQMRKYRNSQTFVCRNISSIKFFPPEWCLSFKHSILPHWPLNFFVAPSLPPDAKIVAFTGKPDIDEAREGWSDPRWYKKLYKHVRPTPWIAEHWR
jgi:hypothetical protein